MVDSPPYLIGSVDKALTIVGLLRERGSCGVSELGGQLEVSRSTAHRLLGTLMHHGFVEQDPTNRSYRLGPALRELGVETAELSRLRTVAMPHIEALSRVFRETVQLMIYESTGCRFIDGISGDRPLNTTVRRGSVLPVYATAGGKALLAQLSDERVKAMFPTGPPAITDRTVPTTRELLVQLRAVRENGFAVNSGESEDGISAVGVAIYSEGKAIAALAMSLPSVRMRAEAVPGMVEGLKRCAEHISRDLALGERQ
jgi:DNA-binding IclR family transcriptional regulator